jgi:GNAT superfamily N-acetyltransferase
LLIRELVPADIAQCEAILRGLPEWFGFETALLQYVEDLARLPALVAVEGDRVLGFIALHPYGDAASEVHVLAVRRDCHRRGIGRALVEAAEKAVLAQGVKLLQVKTLGPSNDDAGYAKTRAFYSSLGFIPLEETTAFWGEQQPTLIMVKPLRRDGG